MAPGVWASTVHNALIQHCEILKDRFAILDPQDGLSIAGIQTAREPLDTKYAALYYPWVEVRDPSVRRNVYVAPSGHMAGIYARGCGAWRAQGTSQRSDSRYHEDRARCDQA